jgi:hypothetical protein
MTTKVDSSGLFRTSRSSSLTPFISAAFSSALTDWRSGVVPSRVTWMVTMGLGCLS